MDATEKAARDFSSNWEVKAAEDMGEMIEGSRGTKSLVEVVRSKGKGRGRQGVRP